MSVLTQELYTSRAEVRTRVRAIQITVAKDLHYRNDQLCRNELNWSYYPRKKRILEKQKAFLEPRGDPVGRFQSSEPLTELEKPPKALGR